MLTIPSSAAVPPESLLVRYVRAHVRRGEKSKERADHAREKADQHFIAAGQYLITLKANYSRTWEEWETLLKTKVKLSTGRASELMQIADGRKDPQQIRNATTQRVRALRARGSSLQGQSNEEDIPDDLPEGPESERATAGLGPRSHALGQRAAPSDDKGDPVRLIDALAKSDAKTRGTAAEALISGSRQANSSRSRMPWPISTKGLRGHNDDNRPPSPPSQKSLVPSTAQRLKAPIRA